MLEIRIPDPTRPFFSQRVTLDGTDYVLRLEWNMRHGWEWSLYDANEDPIALGRKLVVAWPLLLGLTDERTPPGNLIVYDTTGKNDYPGLNDLGARHRLIYLTAAETT